MFSWFRYSVLSVTKFLFFSDLSSMLSTSCCKTSEIISFITSRFKAKSIEAGMLANTFMLFHRKFYGSVHLYTSIIRNGLYFQTFMDEGLKIKKNNRYEFMKANVILGLGSLTKLRSVSKELGENIYWAGEIHACIPL